MLKEKEKERNKVQNFIDKMEAKAFKCCVISNSDLSYFTDENDIIHLSFVCYIDNENIATVYGDTFGHLFILLGKYYNGGALFTKYSLRRLHVSYNRGYIGKGVGYVEKSKRYGFRFCCRCPFSTRYHIARYYDIIDNE